MYNYSLKKNYKFFITVFITILCLLTTLISVGFSALNQNLNISGDIDYEINRPTLYNVLKQEAKLGTYAQEYTGEHQDSMNIALSTEKIYHWFANNDTDANTILDKWNVIFAGFCWQMIRTTDTGGVKLIYNGVPTDGTCNNTGTAQQIGTRKFNTEFTMPSDVGYMYNTRYDRSYKTTAETIVLATIYMNGSSNYYYGTGVTYDSSTSKYILTGVTQDTWTNIYSSSSGLYTCKSTTDTTCSTVYYVSVGDSGHIYGIQLKNGNLLNYYNTNIKLGTAYTESNGTFTITNTTTITKSDWGNNYSIYKNYYTCGDNTTTCTNLQYITVTENYRYYSISPSDNYIYAKDFTYNSETDTYTLSSDRYQTWNITNTDATNLATHHYTCLNATGQCQTLSYVYYACIPSSGVYIRYISLTGGKSIENAVNEMLYDDNVNTIDSIIKTYIDNWYANNMTSYTSYLEDIIFCNNRVQSNATINGWNPNGGKVGITMSFNSDTLKCTNDTDKFSVSNNKAKLTYPVGLAGFKETKLLNRDSLRKTGQNYWLGSPAYLSDWYHLAYGYLVCNSGNHCMHDVDYAYGVRPVVSLKPGTEYTSGDGSKINPYVVE